MLTDITFLLDRSGSMTTLVRDTIGGFNTLIENQKKVEGEAVVTLCQFDDKFQVDYEGVPIVEVPKLDTTTFVPRGMTALLDAIGRTIALTKERLVKNPADKVIFVVVTDGYENASKELGGANGKAKVKVMIEELTKGCIACGSNLGGWEFVFTGANIDAIHEGISIGVAGSGSLNYVATPEGTRHLYETVNRAMTESRVTGQSVSFTDEDRQVNS